MDTNKIVNFPNIITLCRLLLIPFFIIALFQNKINIALIIFAIIALSDKIDGISPRLMKQVTRFGSAFDSFTDWTFMLTCIIAGMYGKYLSIIYGILMLIPLISIALLKLYLINKSNMVLSVVNKITVGFGYTTILAGLIDFVYKDFFLVVSLIMAYITVANFVINAIRKS